MFGALTIIISCWFPICATLCHCLNQGIHWWSEVCHFPRTELFLYFHFKLKLLRYLPEEKKEGFALCGSFLLTLQLRFHFWFHAQYAHYFVIHNVLSDDSDDAHLFQPPPERVKTQPCDVTAWVTVVLGKCGWQLCFSKQPHFLL